MSTIFPTHTCFDDVLDHQVDLELREPAIAARQFIVHGICLIPEGVHAGEPYAHAWVEDDAEARVYEAGILGDGRRVWWGADRAEWERNLRPQVRTRYTLAQAILMNLGHGHYGPWVPAYREVCGRRGRVVFGEEER